MKPVVVLLAAAFALGSSVHGASARGDTVVVKYGELDLAKPAGRAAFMARLQVAAGRVCGREPHDLSLNYRYEQAHAACMQDAMEGAMASLPADVAMKLDRSPAQRQAGLR